MELEQKTKCDIIEDMLIEQMHLLNKHAQKDTCTLQELIEISDALVKLGSFFNPYQ